MKLTLDFDNNTVITEHGVIEAPNLSNKKKEILELLDLKEISGKAIFSSYSMTWVSAAMWG